MTKEVAECLSRIWTLIKISIILLILLVAREAGESYKTTEPHYVADLEDANGDGIYYDVVYGEY